LHPSLIKTDQSKGGAKGEHRCIQAFQILYVKLQENKRWSLLSMKCLQKKHFISPVYPQPGILSPVDNLFFITSH
jgi:3-hydroxymyristoyl/3-hydroxydecanoyl-(acyl carrier protein) dehydratase